MSDQVEIEDEVAIATPSRVMRPNFGPFSSEAEALNAVVTRLVTALDPAAIYLFGSRARGDARSDSDFDLMVVAQPGQSFKGDAYLVVYEPIRGLGVGCDLVPCLYDDFIAEQADPSAMMHHLFTEGRCLYEAEGGLVPQACAGGV